MESRITQYEDYLRKTGCRLTRERRQVAEFLFRFSGPFEPAKVVSALTENSPERKVAISTVYRTLKQLQAAGLIVRD